MRRLATALVAGALVVGLSACAEDQPFEDAIAQRNGAADRVTPERTLADALPNARFQRPGHAPTSTSAAVVVGHVTGGETLSAHRDEGASVPLDDPGFHWQRVRIGFEITELVAGTVADPSAISFAMTGLPSLDGPALIKQLRSYDRLVVILDRPTESETLPRVHWSDTFLTPVASDGSFTFASYGLGIETFQDGIDTLAELREAATVERPVIQVDENWMRL
jgi:hypothetical protein